MGLAAAATLRVAEERKPVEEVTELAVVEASELEVVVGEVSGLVVAASGPAVEASEPEVVDTELVGEVRGPAAEAIELVEEIPLEQVVTIR